MKEVRLRIVGYRNCSLTALSLFDPGLTVKQLTQVERLAKKTPALTYRPATKSAALITVRASTEEEAKFTLIDFFDNIHEELKYKLRIITL